VTEIRTTSSTGGQKGVKPERHALLPKKGIAAIARVFAFGAIKYAAHNWRKRYEWDKSIDALQRHVDAFVDGETYDPESKLPHLAHAGFHILVLLTWLEEDGEGVDNPFDTRWPAAMERLRLAELEEREPEAVNPFEGSHIMPCSVKPVFTQTNLGPSIAAIQAMINDMFNRHPR
jgi:hypothetical protein